MFQQALNMKFALSVRIATAAVGAGGSVWEPQNRRVTTTIVARPMTTRITAAA